MVNTFVAVGRPGREGRVHWANGSGPFGASWCSVLPNGHFACPLAVNIVHSFLFVLFYFYLIITTCTFINTLLLWCAQTTTCSLVKFLNHSLSLSEILEMKKRVVQSVPPPVHLDGQFSMYRCTRAPRVCSFLSFRIVTLEPTTTITSLEALKQVNNLFLINQLNFSLIKGALEEVCLFCPSESF